MGLRLPALLIAVAGCGRIGFDPPGSWAATIGDNAAAPTAVARLIEGPDDAVWAFGTTYELGPNYANGWFATLDPGTGSVIDGGLRAFTNGRGEEHIQGALLAGSRFLVYGSSYSAAASQQPTLGWLDLAGHWTETREAGRDLLDPGEYESFEDAVETGDGDIIVVGYSRRGVGGCAACAGADALALRIDPQLSVLNAQTVGTSYGDEAARRIVALPGNNYMVVGGGFSQFDYGRGGVSDIDSAPSQLYGIGSMAEVYWWRELAYPSSRGARIADAVFDPATGHVVVAGYTGYGSVPIIAELEPDGGGISAVQVALDDRRGEITSIALAEDGGLFIAGYHHDDAETMRTVFFARLAPTRDRTVWAFSAETAYSQQRVIVVPSRRGDLLVAVPAAGARTAAMIARIGRDGAAPACWDTRRATLTVTPVTGSAPPEAYDPTPYFDADLVPLAPAEAALGSAAAARCD